MPNAKIKQKEAAPKETATKKATQPEMVKDSATAVAPPAVASATAVVRMPNMNLTQITGRLTRDPRFVQLTNGSVLNFDIAHNDGYRDQKTGEWIDKKPTFHRVAVFGPNAVNLKDRLQKGTGVFIAGRNEFRMGKDPKGNAREEAYIKAISVQVLSRGKSMSQNKGQGQEVGD